MREKTEVIRMLFLPRERFPTFRGRIAVLFGRELFRRGHQIDLVMQAASADVQPGPREWCGRTVHVGATDTGTTFFSRLRKHYLGFMHDVMHIWSANAATYDAILVSDKFLVAIVAAFVCRLRRLKFFFWLTFPEHESQLLRARNRSARYPWLAWVRGVASSLALRRIVIPLSDHLFVQSPQMADNFKAWGVDAHRMTAILTGVDLADFPAVAVIAPDHAARPFTIAYLGTLDRERRLEVLVEALDILRRQGIAIELLFIGDGDKPGDREALEASARQLGLSEHMKITGFLKRHEALTRLASCDIGISPFYPNGILEVASPTKLVEYMAMGLPVVANDQAEQRAVLRESRAGVRVPWGASYFARAIRWLHERTAAERSQMGARGRQWVEANRTYARIADEFERNYLAALISDRHCRSAGCR